MWRVQGFVGRVLNRCHGNTPLRLTQGHHREDEVRNTSNILSSSCHGSENRDDGEQKRRKRASQFCYAGLPRYAALDAVGWGTAALLFMQLCRRIHSQFSSVGETNLESGHHRDLGHLQKCGYRILLESLSRRNVRPHAANVNCLKAAPVSLEDDYDSGSSSSHSHRTPESEGLHSDSSPSVQQGALSSEEINNSDEYFFNATSLCDQKEPETQKQPKSLSPEEKVTEAAEHMTQVTRSSVPVILNIVGLDFTKTGDYEAAFSCFLSSAQHHYSKAQFNVGVCFEKGWGVQKDLKKALQFYRQAADAGHTQAQYRCAKLLLSSRGQQSAEDPGAAIALLQRAAAAGLTEAQRHLGVVYSREPVRDGEKSAHYLRIAAQSGDALALLYLGQCYESGFGVPQCHSTAANLYSQAATKGNKHARNLLTSLYSREGLSLFHHPREAALRSIRSAPCFSNTDQLTLGSMLFGRFWEVGPTSAPVVDLPVKPLPHSWSTGSFRALPAHALTALTSEQASGP
ncbi:death ligand signal enhancer [Denticeps clupeoides]|uniref:Death ligand signal enhancer n=1 Tax=Denticeps clupeoides TaxID=299321 RepID=A0AAY4EE16_9TELE|nr:death ligand signal enhancer [Denticeps clupeoides]